MSAGKLQDSLERKWKAAVEHRFGIPQIAQLVAGLVIQRSPLPVPFAPASLFSGGSTTHVANRASMWKQDESGRVHTPLEPVVLGATLALIPVLIVEADTTSPAWRDVATAANWIIWAIFAAELTAVLVFAPRKRAACTRGPSKLRFCLDADRALMAVPLRQEGPPSARWRRSSSRRSSVRGWRLAATVVTGLPPQGGPRCRSLCAQAGRGGAAV